jgi:hypothetical protein
MPHIPVSYIEHCTDGTRVAYARIVGGHPAAPTNRLRESGHLEGRCACSAGAGDRWSPLQSVVRLQA